MNCNRCVYGDGCIDKNPKGCSQFKNDSRMTDCIEGDLRGTSADPIRCACGKDDVMGISTNMCPQCWMRKISREQAEDDLGLTLPEG